ncbi:MAG: histidine kinase [Clostridium sp.]|nr:histidine kinase [Clostridium sp.]
MDEQRVLFERLKDIKDYWVDSSVKRLNEQEDLVPSECEEEYKVLKTLLETGESKIAYKKIMNNAIEGVIHSILVMLDGGDELTDKFNIDIINSDTKKSLKEDSALHEEFFGYLLDVEENE